jgi:hypothetical protein
MGRRGIPPPHVFQRVRKWLRLRDLQEACFLRVWKLLKIGSLRDRLFQKVVGFAAR